MASFRTYFEGAQTQVNHTTCPNVEQGLEDATYETADHWSKISVGHSQLGEQEAALDARRMAVEVYRLLHAKQPEVFTGNLARELLGLSKDLASNGLIEEAFNASQESGMLYRLIIGNIAEYKQIQKFVWPCRYIRDDTVLAGVSKFVPGLFDLSKSIFNGIITYLLKPTSR
ncbi:unnamed protein product [Rhizoctonia solani]|uniref:Uncharacterized protein n=1 Tax=Rhizoctonia solani TaxID=456999 RepID=A0A8H3HCQ8_9AGAM|nr:unnamed protein product [Rhizoctonia solani]